MKKIPTLFKRVFDEDGRIETITDEITPGCEEAFKKGVATVKRNMSARRERTDSGSEVGEMSYPRKNGKSEMSLSEFNEFNEWVDSLEETPVDYVEAAKLLQKNRKECAEWLKGKDTFWILSEKGADDGTDKP